jgi:poly(A) polymerase
LQGLAAVDRENGLDVDALLRLAALLSDAPDVARSIAARLRLSNAGRDRLIAAVSANDEISATLTREQMGKLLYRLGPSYFCDRILLEWAAGGRDEQWRALLSYADRWRPPRFPIDGRDVTILGIDEGPEVGALLREVEDWWIAQDFKPDRNALLARLREAAAKNTL